MAKIDEVQATTESKSQTGTSEWRQGKMMLVSAAMGIGLSAIPTYTLGVFIGPLARDTGWPPSTIVLAQALTSLIVGIGSPFAGMLLDKWGARPLALAGAVIQSCAVASLALLTPSLWLYFGIWAMLGIGVILSSAVVWLRPVIERFVVHRGFAVSLALCGSNIAGAIAPVLAAYILAQYGWRMAYVGLGVYMAVSSLPLGFLYLHDNKALAKRERMQVVVAATDDEGLTTHDAVRDRNFWFMASSFFLAGAGITGYIVHLVPMLTMRGVTPLLAASAVSALSVSAILGRLMAGFLMDRLFAPRIAAIALALPIPAAAVLLFATGNFVPGLVAAILVGLSTGAEFNMISYLVARYFGMRSYGMMSGLMYGVFTLGCLVGPPLVAFAVSMHGDYRMAQLLLTASFGLASILMLFCSAYPKFSRATV